MPREGDDDTSSRAGSIVDVTSTPPIATSHPRLPAAQGEPQVQDNAFTTAQLSLADNTTGDNDVPAVILLRRKDVSKLKRMTITKITFSVDETRNVY